MKSNSKKINNQKNNSKKNDKCINKCINKNTNEYTNEYNTYIGPKGYSILKDELSVTEQNKIRKDLMVKPFSPPNSIQKPQEFPIYRESSKKLYIPRFYGIEHFGQPKSFTISDGDDIDIVFEGSMRDYQVNIVNTYLKEAEKTGCGLLEIPCGRGKTVMALNIISQLKKKTLVIVHKEFLMNQWIERIQQFLPSARVGKIQGQILDIKNKDVVIGMLQSLSMKEYPTGTFDSFGLTISDECFPAGTKVLTEKGYINIEELKEHVGKIKVLSYNHDLRETEYKLITNWFENKPKQCIEITYDDDLYTNTKITCSEDHLIYDRYQKTYVSAKDYKIDRLGVEFEYGSATASGLSPDVALRILEKKRVGYKGKLYDIEVEDNHNYFACDGVYPGYKYASPILVHNCHHISAEVFCRSLFKIVTPYMLGLSATMNRKDGLTKVFKLFLGDVVYKEERKSDDEVVVKTIQYKNNDPDFSETVYNFKGQTHYAIMIRKLCEFNNRSELILKVLQDLIKEDDKRQVMILAHNKSLLKYLYDAIEHRNIASVGYYVGGMKESALKETESKKVVIATYAMAEEALDIKTLSALILATPKTDVTQAVGRILRMKHENPVVVDIVDQHDIFQKQYIKRRRFYMKCKYKILQTTSHEYLSDKDTWDIMFEPKESKQYKKKIEKKEMEKKGMGKCLLDFSKYT